MDMGDPVARRRLALVAAGGGLLLLLLVAGAWLMLAGDARQEPAARPATQAGAAPAAVLASLDDEPVLRALFGEWDPKTRTAVVQASRLAPAGPGQQASADDRMQVGIHARLPFTEGGRDKTAVLLQSVELDDGGAPIECHACGALLGVHVYARAGDGRGWVRERGSNNVVHVGAYGALPAASLVELAPGRTGLLMTYGDVGGGYARSLGMLVDIGGDTPREASGYIDLGASNEGACDVSVKPGTPTAREPAEACWSYQGTLLLAPPATPRAPQGPGAIAWHDLTVRWRGTRAAPDNRVDAFEQSVTVQHDGRTWPGRVAPKLLLP
jgi:hypothetical protein